MIINSYKAIVLIESFKIRKIIVDVESGPFIPHFLFSNNLKQFSLSTAQNTLEDVRVISLEGQIAFQKIELEKLKEKMKKQR